MGIYLLKNDFTTENLLPNSISYFEKGTERIILKSEAATFEELTTICAALNANLSRLKYIL